MKKLRVTIEGKSYDVIVEELGEIGTPAPMAPVASSGVDAPVISSSATPSSSAPGDVPSPLSGRVIEVDCQVGQVIEIGDRLATVEAMKMNTYVHAQSAGRITAVHVKVGDPVEEGHPLVTIA